MVKKILVVEDEIDILKLVKRCLLREKFEVITAELGKVALDIISSTEIDLMILDINLPDMEGWDICKKIKSSPIYKNLPIIMLTVRNAKEDKLKGFDYGTDEYMTKPFTPRELVARVKTVLQRAENFPRYSNPKQV